MDLRALPVASSNLTPRDKATGCECGTNFMYVLKLIGLTIFNLLKAVWRLPQTITLARQQKQRQVAQDEFEINRIERLRHPSKYAGR